MSYNDHEEVRRLYEGFRIEEVKVRYHLGSKGGQAKRISELLIMNYDPKTREKLA